VTTEDALAAKLKAIREQVEPHLNRAFDLMEEGETKPAVELVANLASPSDAHLVCVLSLLAASSASVLRKEMPATETGYYGFLALDADTHEATELPAPMAFSSRFLISACNLDQDQGRALIDHLLDSDDDYKLSCLVCTFVQAFHIHSGHTDLMNVDLGSTTMRGLAITTDTPDERDTEN
jgi:hypothetical protein